MAKYSITLRYTNPNNAREFKDEPVSGTFTARAVCELARDAERSFTTVLVTPAKA